MGLFQDIDDYKKIKHNAKLFIHHKNIKLHRIKNKLKIQESDLPNETLLGSVFLIKGNNIIECYAWCDFDYSMYVQINQSGSAWRGSIDAVNIEEGDPHNIEFMLDGGNSYMRPSIYQYGILQFIQSGFDLYVK